MLRLGSFLLGVCVRARACARVRVHVYAKIPFFDEIMVLGNVHFLGFFFSSISLLGKISFFPFLKNFIGL